MSMNVEMWRCWQKMNRSRKRLGLRGEGMQKAESNESSDRELNFLLVYCTNLKHLIIKLSLRVVFSPIHVLFLFYFIHIAYLSKWNKKKGKSIAIIISLLNNCIIIIQKYNHASKNMFFNYLLSFPWIILYVNKNWKNLIQIQIHIYICIYIYIY